MVALSLSALFVAGHAEFGAIASPSASATPNAPSASARNSISDSGGPGLKTEQAAQVAQSPSDRKSENSSSKSARQQAFESLQRFDSRSAILSIVPQIIADAKRPLKDKENALRLAQDLEYISKALYFDENETAAAQVQEMSVALCPEQERFKAILGDYLSRAGRPAEAAKILAEAKPDEKTDATMLKMMIQYKTRNSDNRGAKALAEKYKDRADLKDDPWFQSIRARAWLKSGLNKMAAKILRQAAEKEKNEYNRHLWLAAVSSFEGHPATSKDDLDLAAKALPGDPLWRVDVAAINAGKDADESFERLLEALRCDRLCSRGYVAYTRRMNGEHHFDRALSSIDYVGRLKPGSAEVHFERARVLKAQEKFKESAAEFAEGLKLQPCSAMACLDLATVFGDLKDPDNALKTLLKATKQIPNNPRIWLALGHFYAKEGKLDESEAAYKQCLTLVPQPIADANVLMKNEVGVAHAHLASIYYRRGDRPAALREAATFNELKVVLELPGLSAVHLRPGRLPTTPSKLEAERQEHEAVLLADALFESKNFDDSAKEYRKAIAIHPDDSDLHSYLLNALAEKGDWGAAAGEDLNLSNSILKELPKNLGGFFHPQPK
ncbi:MAG TPA: tetratricopeptide repeat protein [Oculatellaceae cyanobacterium]